MNSHMKANLKLFLSLLAVVVVFGSQSSCTIQVAGCGPPPTGTTEEVASPSSGCMNQMPTYSLGEPPNKDEYTVIAQEFKIKKSMKEADIARLWSEAQAVSADLRAKRAHNSVWMHPDGSAIVVSVGRYFTEKQADDKLSAILRRGYPDAHVGKPLYPKKKDDTQTTGGEMDWAGIVAMFIIVVLVLLGVSSQTKK